MPHTYESWKSALSAVSKDKWQKWEDRSKKIIKRYRDDRGDSGSTDGNGSARFNILWANVQTLLPAVCARVPKASVKRRFNDQDPVGRVASSILERALDFENDHYEDFAHALKHAVEDRLLPGRGVNWLRYEPQMAPYQPEEDAELPPDAEGSEITDDAEEAPEMLVGEHTPVDYVYWRDFRHSPHRIWEEVTWVARRVYMNDDAMIARFGEELAKEVPKTNKPGNGDSQSASSTQNGDKSLESAEVWEIWSKDDRTVYWMSPDYDQLLDQKEDPLRVEGFFPCPKPLFATTTSGTLVPVPDFVLYQDQADQLDEVTNRLKLLTKACMVRGLYGGESKDIQRLFTEGGEAQLIPVDNWQDLQAKGGLEALIAWVPINMITEAMQTLKGVQSDLISEIYQLTGISDIQRGDTDADETAAAQQIKATFGSMRLKMMQRDVAAFASGVLRIKAQIMCLHYQPQTLISMSGIDQTDDGKNPDLLQQALLMLKDDPARNFRIEVDADSLVMLDEHAEQQNAVEFLETASQFLTSGIEAINNYPPCAPLVGKMLLYGIRHFKDGQQLETDFEQLIAQMQPPPPKPPAGQEAAQAAQAKAQAAIQTAQGTAQIQQQTDKYKADLQAQTDANEQRYQAMQIAAQQQAEQQTERMKQTMQAHLQAQQQASDAAQAKMQQMIDVLIARIVASSRIETAEVTAGAQLQAAQISAANQAEAGPAE